MVIESIRVPLMVRVSEGITATVWGWAVAIDGTIITDESGDAVYFSVNRADIEREIRRLGVFIANSVRNPTSEA